MLSQLVKVPLSCILGRGIEPSHIHFAAGRNIRLGLPHGILQAADLIRLIRFLLRLGVSHMIILKMS